MSEQNTEENGAGSAKKSGAATRFAVSTLGFAALACVVASAFYGWREPFCGAVLFAAGIVAAVLAFLLGIVFRSPQARRFAALGILAAIIVAAIGGIALLFDKDFEDRCVAAWEKIVSVSDDVERRVERVEDRFESVSD